MPALTLAQTHFAASSNLIHIQGGYDMYPQPQGPPSEPPKDQNHLKRCISLSDFKSGKSCVVAAPSLFAQTQSVASSKLLSPIKAQK